jgi:uncharacterized protein with GYD domain
MEHAKLMIIYLGNSAPDFLSIFNDDSLRTVKKKIERAGNRREATKNVGARRHSILSFRCFV